MSRTLASGTDHQTIVDGEAQLRAALTADPDAVRKLMSLVETDDEGNATNRGIMARLNAELDAITSSANGTIANQNLMLSQRIEQFEDEATRLQERLDAKEARLYAQFQAMETALADLQSQQSSLSSLVNLIGSSGS